MEEHCRAKEDWNVAKASGAVIKRTDTGKCMCVCSEATNDGTLAVGLPLSPGEEPQSSVTRQSIIIVFHQVKRCGDGQGV